MSGQVSLHFMEGSTSKVKSVYTDSAINRLFHANKLVTYWLAASEPRAVIRQLVKDEGDDVCVYQMDKFLTNKNLNREVLRTFQRSPHYFIDGEAEQEQREWASLSDTTFVGKLLQSSDRP
ncbi:hypothetical protein T265_03523 [Opisthorchis viverrini]|uniref:Uncharacterized protein n=1 Tax=Opisthorchis viverrini TaxID=6198 RepID=A0A075AHI3_OPIVI|nr:hypothetical protein T265_03523 [Opisthorchis viverrini]KER29934.1 hypothetical protein T265_03523 [Opisthorchis viverrini]